MWRRSDDKGVLGVVTTSGDQLPCDGSLSSIYQMFPWLLSLQRMLKVQISGASYYMQ